MADKKVRMIAQIGGARDGKDWPKPGEFITVPQEEAEQLIRNGLAADAAANKPEENALADVLGVEVATAGNKSIRAQLKPAPHADEVQAYHVPVLPGEVPAAEEGQEAVDEGNKDLGVDIDAHKAQRHNGPDLEALKDTLDSPVAKAAKRAPAKADEKKDEEK